MNRRPLLGPPSFRHLQNLVFHEQIVNRFTQEDGLCDPSLIGELIEQSGLLRLQVERLQLLYTLGFGSHAGIM